MKRLFLWCVIFFLSCYGALVPVGAAISSQRGEHTPSNKMLEFSLIRLKESIQKTLQKNERLTFENDMLRKGIFELREIKETLLAKRAELSGEYYPQRKTLFRTTVDMESRQKRTRQLIMIFERNIRGFEEKVREADALLDVEAFDFHEKDLMERKEKSEKDLRQAEKRLKVLKRQNMDPIGRIEGLKRAQNDLVEEMEELRFSGFLM